MGRRQKVEGLTLDLTRVVEGQGFCIEELIVVDPPTPIHVPRPKLSQCQLCNIVWKCRYVVNGVSACYMCYALSKASVEVAQFIRGIYRRPCEFCGVTDKITQFDHVNMFRKRSNILDMVSCSIEDIQSEIDKCQLLCIRCHKKVTAAERAHGFTIKKTQLTRRKQNGEDVSEMLAQYAQEYDSVMESIYAQLRENNSG
jgi:hypothetical protein